MTTAAPIKNENRILRIGILQAGKIVEERLLRKREPITVGQSAKNTFYIPVSKLPKELMLFDVRANKYLLMLQKDVEGRVSMNDKVMTLEELQSAPGVVDKGGVKCIPLDEKSRGKLTVGDVSVLFQFVSPPPVVPRPTLPASARSGIGHAIMRESAFAMAIVASLIVQGGFVALSMIYDETPDRRMQQPQFVQMLRVDVEFLNRKNEEEVEEPEKKKEEEAKKEAEAEKKPEEAPVVVKPPPMPENKPTPIARKPSTEVAKVDPKPKPGVARPTRDPERRREQVVNKTFLKSIMQDGPGLPGGPGAQVAGGHNEKIQAAFDRTGVVGSDVAEKGFEGGPRLEGGPNAGPRVQNLSDKEKKEAGIGGALKVETVAKAPAKAPEETKLPTGRVGLAGPQRGGGIGKLDSAAVSGAFKRRASAFRNCYEGRLRDKPNLAGKIVIRFTIGTAGRVTNIDVASNTTGDSVVGSCIVDKVRNMRFDKPENGDVTFTYPIVLSKGN